ncbi:major capsid protein [Dipodfec virus UOA04_Rod_1094]|nr:major capsid protein [Dipodfec virus UOA04_Rod_1094]
MAKRSMQFVFGATPTVSLRRSKFNLSHGLKTSMSIGTLYPLDVTEVLPGDTFRMNEKHVVRLSSAYLRPVMDNCFLDIYYFYVPSRILYDEWENVFGDPNPSAYITTERSEVPHVGLNGNDRLVVAPHSVADYLGLPVGEHEYDPANANDTGISSLPFRGFAMIWNEWFRNENTDNPVNIQFGNMSQSLAFERLNDDPWSPSNYTGMLPKVGKKKDYFTSCLPKPQKGESVNLSLGTSADLNGLQTAPDGTKFLPVNNLPYGTVTTNNIVRPKAYTILTAGSVSDASLGPLGITNINSGGHGISSFAGSNPSGSPYPVYLGLGTDMSNVNVDLSNATAANVNDLRMAFALQKMLEADARYGTRYREYILGHFGVSNADARMQIPEFLGGKRTPLNVQQVPQTNSQSGQDITSPLGALGAFSHSVGSSRFSKSFTEHGYVFCVGCIRQLHTYQQGVDRFWLRTVREDFYDPKFANIGEQPVYSAELDLGHVVNQGKLTDMIFGYNEAWADYRYKPSKITGEMRTGVENTLDIYHFGDYYQNVPTLTSDFIQETPQFFDRTVAVPSSSQDNFVLDFWFDFTAYRVMPVYSVPGLIDHH